MKVTCGPSSPGARGFAFSTTSAVTVLVMLAIGRDTGVASFVARTPSKPMAPTAETPSPGQDSGGRTATPGDGAST